MAEVRAQSLFVQRDARCWRAGVICAGSISAQARKSRRTPRRKDLIPRLSILALQIRPPALLRAAKRTRSPARTSRDSNWWRGKFYYQPPPDSDPLPQLCWSGSKIDLRNGSARPLSWENWLLSILTAWPYGELNEIHQPVIFWHSCHL